MDEELLSLKVPQLILQPVVENAVKYGLRPREASGIIAVNVQVEEEKLLISVMDNGLGMTPQKLKEVQELLKNKETVNHPRSKKASIGLKNAHDRVKLILGEEYGMEIISYEGIGTIVKYILPVMREEEKWTVPIMKEEESHV